MSHSKDSQSKKERKSRADSEFAHDESILPDEDLQDIHSQLIREKAEPTEKMTPVPLFLMFLFGVLLFWGGFYVSKYSGNFRADVFDPDWVPGKVDTAEVVFDPLMRGKKLFSQICQQCHQPDGMGVPGVYPPLVGSPWLLSSDHRPVKILLKGLSGPITVEGKNFNGNMPSHEDWKDRDIAAVLTFVRQNWSNSSGSIAEETVTEIREQIADRKKPWTGPELLKEDPL